MKSLAILILGITIFTSCQQKTTFVKNEGYVFGTSYHFVYATVNGKDYENEIKQELQKFNSSLSTYDPNSFISRINQNDPSVEADSFFEQCFEKAKTVSELTHGAFDLTVAPIVNAWGFGFDESKHADSLLIDSLMQFIGYQKIKLEGKKLIKENPGIMLDASAIAKGQGVDVAANLLEKLGVKNYMVEIGGEVRARGFNPKNEIWKIGIDKPIDDPMVSNRQLQDVIMLKDKSMATSGNYRQFYEKNGVKYSHTINPKTGYPARNSLLSASVLASDCMTADAFATAFMVMGLDESIALSKKLNFVEVYFIYADSVNNYQIYTSDAIKMMIQK
jgi:thiamine biosynthesis lipoprotein